MMTPPEFLYYIGYALKKSQSFRRQRRLPYPVISVGNITVGGTGKTPAVIAVAEEAMGRGFSPVILTRGYKGRAKGPGVVSPRKPLQNYLGGPKTIIQTVKDAGDEPVLMAERLRRVPVIKATDRYEGGVFALQSFSFSSSAPVIFILDDGFQHWRLHRDLDIVLIDGLNPFGNRRMLPLGRMREPMRELKRADIFVITRHRNEELAEELRNEWPEKPVYFSEYRVARAINRATDELPLEVLRDKRVAAFCGIAHPESFERTLLSLPVRLEAFKTYRDHHFYTPAEVDYLERLRTGLGCDLLITTEKDMTKLKTLKITDSFFSLEMSWKADAAFYDAVFRKIAASSK